MSSISHTHGKVPSSLGIPGSCKLRAAQDRATSPNNQGAKLQAAIAALMFGKEDTPLLQNSPGQFPKASEEPTPQSPMPSTNHTSGKVPSCLGIIELCKTEISGPC
eukprot:CAMPEP_0117555806 /NCGR_PEP_ID=MMETSP0784-20121206/51468_1 /TAXON_ID=39447 /ORGANISM="" /LENGTH=105 /DNA_ID=CAMNT_0005353031 /DNA_START=80 /DNA_END=395 /DNA_ORIENTATION=-